jgi:hypothetical protein
MPSPSRSMSRDVAVVEVHILDDRQWQVRNGVGMG